MIALNNIAQDYPESEAVASRKHQFLEAAASVDPFSPMRRHPYSTLLGAAAAGAAVGMATPVISAMAKLLVPILTKGMTPLVTAFITGKLARDKGQAEQAAKESDADAQQAHAERNAAMNVAADADPQGAAAVAAATPRVQAPL